MTGAPPGWYESDGSQRWWTGASWAPFDGSAPPGYYKAEGQVRWWHGTSWEPVTLDDDSREFTNYPMMVIPFGSDNAAKVSTWTDVFDLLTILPAVDLPGIGVSNGAARREVRVLVIGGRYVLDVKRADNPEVWDVGNELRGVTVDFAERQLDSEGDLTPVAVRPRPSVSLPRDDAFRVIKTWIREETLPPGYWAQHMATTAPRMNLELPTVEELMAELRAERESSHVSDTMTRLGLGRPAPPPSPQPYGVNDFGAELLCRDWMRHLGAWDAEVTPPGPDGGIDVISSDYAAQVKNYVGTVGAPEVRQIHGAGIALQRRALFFTSGRYTADAVAFADSVNMPIFVFDAIAGTINAVSNAASRVLERGL